MTEVQKYTLEIRARQILKTIISAGREQAVQTQERGLKSTKSAVFFYGDFVTFSLTQRCRPMRSRARSYMAWV